MRTARLLPVLGGNHFLRGLVDQIFQLQGLDEIGVPDHAAVGDAYIFVFFHNLCNLDFPDLQVLRITVNWRIFLHGLCSSTRSSAVGIEPLLCRILSMRAM